MGKEVFTTRQGRSSPRIGSLNFIIMIENWKDIPGYEGLYQASDIGRIRSYDRIVNSPHNAKRTIKGRIKAIRADSQGRYLIVDLCVASLSKTILVHRLIAKTFIGCVDGFEVNHKDGNPQNNKIDNLEICTRHDQEIHKYRILKRHHPFSGKTGSLSKRSKAVKQIDPISGEIIGRFGSMRQASLLTATHVSSLVHCCKGRMSLANGYKWEYDKYQ